MKQPSKIQVMKNILRNNKSQTSDGVDAKSKNKNFLNPLRNQKIAPSSSASSLKDAAISENPYQLNNAPPSALPQITENLGNKKRRNSENIGDNSSETKSI